MTESVLIGQAHTDNVAKCMNVRKCKDIITDKNQVKGLMWYLSCTTAIRYVLQKQLLLLHLMHFHFVAKLCFHPSQVLYRLKQNNTPIPIAFKNLPCY